jgi:hypothetical protein
MATGTPVSVEEYLSTAYETVVPLRAMFEE